MTARIRLPRKPPRPPQAPPAAEPPPRTWAELTDRLLTLGKADRVPSARAMFSALVWLEFNYPTPDDPADMPPDLVARCWAEAVEPRVGRLLDRFPWD